MRARDEDALLRLAEAVAEGSAVDWARELAAEPELGRELEQLRALEAIAALPSHAAPDPLLGRELSHYRIRERLGAGGMGVVYRAEDQRLHRPVALKVLPPELIASEERRRRLLREARAGAAVVHPSVAAVHEVGEDQGTIFVAMELVEGETLQERIAGRPLPLGVALQIATEMADGLAAAHRAHVIHRDLKPANVMIRPDGHVKILDFGLAKLSEEERSASSEPGGLGSLPAEATREGRLLGTPAYMSPEQVRGEPLDPRSDLYSFGSTLYEMVTGQAPFRRASAAETLTAILRDEPTPASQVHPELPPGLEVILGRCLAKDPAQRYPGAGELAADLRALANRAPALAPGSPPAAGTRQLAAILFSDIVGYTALMEADEARALAARDRHRALLRPIVERFRGELIETPGDEALAVFASSLRAVDCALALQAALRQADDLKLRIGIHVGDVLFRDGEVVGEGVNVAARIRTLAEPGAICVSGAVYEQVKNHPHLHGRSLGSRSLKNVQRPIEVFVLSAPGRELARTRPRRAWLGLAAGALLLAAALFWMLNRPPPAAPAGHSLAVLPFANLSADPDQAYFADGIAEELLNALARFEGLRVVGRTSSFSFRDSDADLKTIGEALGVDVILEGSVRTAGDRVRITVQLVDAGDGFHRWSETYDRELGDIFAIQTEVATAIATSLRVQLSPEQRDRLAAAPTQNFQAYQAYLLGRQRLTRFNAASVAEGVRDLQQAIEVDPSFALAYADLATGYLQLFEISDRPPVEMLARARVAAKRAVQLDDGLAEAHVALGATEYIGNDFEAAEAAFQRALTLNPNSVDANLWYGDMLGQSLGRYEESLALRSKAVELDPLSLETVPRLGDSLQWVGRFDESLSWYERSLEIDPDFAWGHELIGGHHWLVSGRLDEALVWWVKAAVLDPEAPTIAHVGLVLVDLGDPARGGHWIHRAIEQAPENFHTNVAMQRLALYRGDEDAALHHGRKAFAISPYDADVLSLLRDREVAAGRYHEARALYEPLFPELLSERDPNVDLRNYRAALDLVLILSRTGERERAGRLLERSIEPIQKRPRLGGYGSGIADVQLYALRGERQKALSALRQAIDEGWRRDWWYWLEKKPDLEPLHGDPEYQAMVEEIRADVATQLERVRQMEARGELALAEPPAPGDWKAK